MCFYGVGNHGGGPSKAMIEWILANRDFDGHELVFSTPQAYFEAIAGKRDLLPRVTHRAAALLPRLLQRDARHQARPAPRRGAARPGRGGGPRPRRRRRRARRQPRPARRGLGRPPLHRVPRHPDRHLDPVAPGTASAPCRAAPASPARRCSTTSPAAGPTAPCPASTRTRSSSSTPTAGRAAPSSRPSPISTSTTGATAGSATRAGAPVPFQEVQPDSNQLIPRILFEAEIPAAGSRQFQVRAGPPPGHARRPARSRATRDALSNGLVTVALRERRPRRGRARRHRADRQPRPAPAPRHHRHLDLPHRPLGGAGRRRRSPATTGTIEETGPLRVRARLDGRLGNSRIRLTVSLCRGEPALHLELEVNFDERYTLLQMPIDLAAAPSAGPTASPTATSTATPRPPNGRSSAGRGSASPAPTSASSPATVYSHSVNGRAWHADAAAQPAHGLGRRRPAHLCRPRPAHRPGRPPLRLRRSTSPTRCTEADLAAGAGPRPRSRSSSSTATRAWTGPAWGPVPPRGLWGPAMLRNVADGRVADPGQAAPGGLFNRPGQTTTPAEGDAS